MQIILKGGTYGPQRASLEFDLETKSKHASSNELYKSWIQRTTLSIETFRCVKLA